MFYSPESRYGDRALCLYIRHYLPHQAIGADRRRCIYASKPRRHIFGQKDEANNRIQVIMNRETRRIEMRYVHVLTAVFVPFVVVTFMVTVAFAQEWIFVPYVSSPPPGNYPAISWMNCSDTNNDGIDENIYILSKPYPNGTEFSTIREQLHMFPGDWPQHNFRFFPEGRIDAFGGASGVCIPRSYSVVWPQQGEIGFDEGFYAKFNGNVPGWEQNYWNTSIAQEVSVSQVVTQETFMILGFAVVADSWYGAPVVGSYNWGNNRLGSIVKFVAGSRAAAFFGNTALVFVGIDVLADRIIPANTLGLPPMPAIQLHEETYLFMYSKDTEMVYTGCYPKEEALLKAEQMLSPDKIRLLLDESEGGLGCLISRIPQEGILGGTLYPWYVAQQGAIHIVAQREVMSQQDSKDLFDAMQDWLNEGGEPEDEPEPNPTPTPVPAPVRPAQECPRIEGAIQKLLIDKAIQATVWQLAENMEGATEADYDKFINYVEFTEAAQERLPTMLLDDFYKNPRPRNLISFYDGHLNNYETEGDQYGDYWTVEARCLMIRFGTPNPYYEWDVNYQHGPLYSGITGSLHFPESFKFPYPYNYNSVD